MKIIVLGFRMSCLHGSVIGALSTFGVAVTIGRGKVEITHITITCVTCGMVDRVPMDDIHMTIGLDPNEAPTIDTPKA